MPFELRNVLEMGVEVIRHARVPAQMLLHAESQAWVAEPLSRCEENVPMDPACSSGCSAYNPVGHYNRRIAMGILAHQAFAYVAAVDSAFPNRSKDTA